MTERWLPIDGYVGLYEVSDAGRVRALHPPRGDGIMRGDVDRGGYRRVLLTKDGTARRHKVHVLVCTAFNGPKTEGLICGHLNGHSSENNSDNLAWITYSENNKHKKLHGYVYVGHSKGGVAGADNVQAKLTRQQVEEIRVKSRSGISNKMLAKQYWVSPSTIDRIIAGKSYRFALGGAPIPSPTPEP